MEINTAPINVYWFVGNQKEVKDMGMRIKHIPNNKVSGILYSSFCLHILLYKQMSIFPKDSKTKKMTIHAIVIVIMYS